MDQFLEFFLRNFGPSVDRLQPTTEQLEFYRGRLPDQLISYWEELGWCGYANGLFWTVNPKDYEPVVQAWLEGTEYDRKDHYHVIARSAFGELFLWGEKTGPSLSVVPLWGWFAPSKVHNENMANGKANIAVQHYFSMRKKQFINCHDSADKPLFERALKKLGVVGRDEMYGFVPTPALGGVAKLEKLQKLKIIEHLVFLAQVTEPTTLQMPP